MNAILEFHDRSDEQYGGLRSSLQFLGVKPSNHRWYQYKRSSQTFTALSNNVGDGGDLKACKHTRFCFLRRLCLLRMRCLSFLFCPSVVTACRRNISGNMGKAYLYPLALPSNLQYSSREICGDNLGWSTTQYRLLVRTNPSRWHTYRTHS